MFSCTVLNVSWPSMPDHFPDFVCPATACITISLYICISCCDSKNSFICSCYLGCFVSLHWVCPHYSRIYHTHTSATYWTHHKRIKYRSATCLVVLTSVLHKIVHYLSRFVLHLQQSLTFFFNLFVMGMQQFVIVIMAYFTAVWHPFALQFLCLCKNCNTYSTHTASNNPVVLVKPAALTLLALLAIYCHHHLPYFFYQLLLCVYPYWIVLLCSLCCPASAIAEAADGLPLPHVFPGGHTLPKLQLPKATFTRGPLFLW